MSTVQYYGLGGPLVDTPPWRRRRRRRRRKRRRRRMRRRSYKHICGGWRTYERTYFNVSSIRESRGAGSGSTEAGRRRKCKRHFFFRSFSSATTSIETWRGKHLWRQECYCLNRVPSKSWPSHRPMARRAARTLPWTVPKNSLRAPCPGLTPRPRTPRDMGASRPRPSPDCKRSSRLAPPPRSRSSWVPSDRSSAAYQPRHLG